MGTMLVLMIFSRLREAPVWLDRGKERFYYRKREMLSSGPPDMDQAKAFLTSAENRAVDFYGSNVSNEMNRYVWSRAVFSEKGELLGAIVKVDMFADEDMVTFYYQNDGNSFPLLKMAYHDEQSPSFLSSQLYALLVFLRSSSMSQSMEKKGTFKKIRGMAQ